MLNKPPKHQQVVLEFYMQGGTVSINWRIKNLGKHLTPFIPPYNDISLPIIIKALDAVQYPDHPITGPIFNENEKNILNDLGLWQIDKVANDIDRRIGLSLYNAIGKEGQNILERIQDDSVSKGLSTNYSFYFSVDCVSIAALPWEAICDKDNHILLAGDGHLISFERYMNIERSPSPSSPIPRTPYILALSPNYEIDKSYRDLERELRLNSWNNLRERGIITFDEIGPPLTRKKLSDSLRSSAMKPDIIHYFGHGIYRNGKGYLVFDDGNEGFDLVSADRLAVALGGVRLVVIHACKSSKVSEEGGLLSGVAPALSIATGAVVAMQCTISIEAAARFAEVFYEELLMKKRSLQEAVASGRRTLYFDFETPPSWYVPTLHIRSKRPQSIFLVR